MAVVDAARDVVRKLRERAAQLFEVPVDSIAWRDGAAHVVGDPEARSADLLELATRQAKLGGPISSTVSLNARGVGVAFGVSAYLARRLGPTVIAHAIFNGVVMVIVLSGVLDDVDTDFGRLAALLSLIQ